MTKKPFALGGRTWAALLVFGRNTGANAFWEKMGFTERNDIIYRNKSLTEIVRIDT